MLRSMVGVGVAVALVACGHAAPRAAPRATLKDCGVTRAYLLEGRSQVPLRRHGQLPVTMEVGDRIRVRVTGNCADTVVATTQGHLLRSVGRTAFEATAQGVERLSIGMPACPPVVSPGFDDCLGGMDELGLVLVTVGP